MNNEYIQTIYNTCKSKQEFIDKLNIPYLHRSGTSVDNDILKCLSFISDITKTDISAAAFRKRYNQRLIKLYNQNPNKCIICGNIIPYDRKDTYTCCKKCCHIKANKERGPISKEIKERISAGVIRNLIENGLTKHTTKIPTKFKLLSECISLGILENYNNVDYVDRYINPNRCKEHICPICGKVYHTYLANNGKLTNYSACSKECLNIKMKTAVSNKVQERIKKEYTKGGNQEM